MEIDADIDLGCVAPDIVPDVVGEELRATATSGRCDAGEDAVDICQGCGYASVLSQARLEMSS